MILWIDGDACPREIKEIVYKAAIRKNILLKYIANSYHRIPQNKLFSFTLVDKSPDAADQHILDHSTPGDIVVTADIPLAHEAIKRKCYALNPKGEVFTEANINEKLATRNLLHELRSAGTITGGPRPLTQQDKMKFANALDRALAKSH